MIMEERQGFEPWEEVHSSTVFKTAAFNRSAISPRVVIIADIANKCLLCRLLRISRWLFVFIQITISDASLAQIIRRHFHSDGVAG